MTTLEVNPTQLDKPAVDEFDGYEWDEDGSLVPAPADKPVHLSHLAAKAAAINDARAQVPGLDFRPESWLNTWKAAINHPSATPLLQQAVDGAPAGDRTSPGRLREFLNLIATFTSWNGKDPVYSLRKTLAAEMNCSVSVVSRCAMAAERARLVTEGVQQWWLDIALDGMSRFIRSSVVRMLVLPPAIRSARKDAKEDKRLQKEAVEQAQLREQKVREQARAAQETKARDKAAAASAELAKQQKQQQTRPPRSAAMDACLNMRDRLARRPDE